MQAASDIFLGWIRSPKGIDGVARDFYVRQLWDWKVSVDVETIRPSGLVVYAEVCGWTLARAHARSGDRIAIASYLGKGDVFDRALADFAVAYAGSRRAGLRTACRSCRGRPDPRGARHLVGQGVRESDELGRGELFGADIGRTVEPGSAEKTSSRLARPAWASEFASVFRRWAKEAATTFLIWA